jgi:prevent-host-death family protein
MPESVGVRELRQNLSKYLDRVKDGEVLVVTERGREVAQLVPSRRIPEVYLRAAELFGATIPTGRWEDVIARLPEGPRFPAGTTDAFLAEDRSEREFEPD